MAKRRPSHRVVAVAHDRLSLFELSVAAEVFGLKRDGFDSWYSLKTCGIEPGPLRATGGLAVSVNGGLRLLSQADTIVVPGWKGVDVPVPARLTKALCAAHARGARLVSFCSGAFVLAATGLLDGRRATTHWRYAEALAEQYPEIEVDPAVLYVDEGRVLTSAGSAAAIDLSLHLVRKDFGAEKANLVARRLVVPPHRDGGQAQFVQTRVDEAAEETPMSQLLDWMRAHLDESLSVSDLAAQAKMSERSFARRFRAQVGTTPGAWLIRERVLASQTLLEGDDYSIDEVAQLSGFGSTPTFRHHFVRQVGLAPSKYRQRFASGE